MDKIENKIKELRVFAKNNFVPIVRDDTISKICSIIKEKEYSNLLEIGTAIGYSAICMLTCNTNAKITTIEKNKQRFEEAVKNFESVDLSDRVNPICGDALEELRRLVVEKKKFDFIFLDGPKGQYINYLPLLKKLMTDNATLFADNILLGGLIKNESLVNHKNRTMFTNMKKFLKEIENDSDFQTQIFEIDDGFSISMIKNSAE